MNVGLALKDAINRGREHKALCSRVLNIRFMTQWGGTPEKRTGVTSDGYDSPGLLIRAFIAARSGDELDAQERGHCEVVIPWDELDARAGELVDIVDSVVAAAEVAVGLKARG